MPRCQLSEPMLQCCWPEDFLFEGLLWWIQGWNLLPGGVVSIHMVCDVVMCISYYCMLSMLSKNEVSHLQKMSFRCDMRCLCSHCFWIDHCLYEGEVWRGGKVASTSWRCKSWWRKPRRKCWLQTGSYIIVPTFFFSRNDSELEDVVLLNKQRVLSFLYFLRCFFLISQMKSLKKSHSWNPDCKRCKSWRGSWKSMSSWCCWLPGSHDLKELPVPGPYWCDCIVLEPHPMGCQPSTCRQGKVSESWEMGMFGFPFNTIPHIWPSIGLQLIRFTAAKGYMISLYRLLFIHFRSYPWQCISSNSGGWRICYLVCLSW